MSDMLHIKESFAIAIPQLSEAVTQRVTEALLPAGGSQALEVKIAAIHEGLTRNNTFYSKNGLTNREKNDQGQIGGLESWTKPYEVPVVKDHEASADNVIGRVVGAEWVEKQGSTPGHVEITARITNPEAIQKFIRGEYSTGSIGMDVDKAECSICGSDFMKGWRSACEHERGKWYAKGTEKDSPFIEAEPHAKGARRMHINVGNVWAREYSVVAVPSDAKSKVKSFELKEMAFHESEDNVLNLLEGVVPAAIVESEETTTEEIKVRSVAELMPYFYESIEEDLLGTYFSLAMIEASEGSYLTKHGEEVVTISSPELAKVREQIVLTNEDLEDELNAIAEAVLSSEKTQNLPDSSFALIGKVDEKTFRLFPYRDEKNVVNQEQLLTALAWVREADNFSAVDRHKALKKLVAAARKAKVGQSTRAEELEAAKALLAEEGLEAVTSAELVELRARPEANTETAELEAKIEELTGELEEANEVIIERETENAELFEQLGDLTEQVQELVTSISEKVTELTPEEEREALANLSSMELTGKLISLAQEAQDTPLVLTTSVERSGLGNGSARDEYDAVNQKEAITAVLMAKLGSKRAKHQIFE